MSILLENQMEFSRMVEQLLLYAFEQGYGVTLGDAYRDPRVFGKIGVNAGYGHPKSAHKARLAIDLNLYKGGHYLENTEDHEPLGVFWEKIGGAWGGRFSTPDGNHYSIEFDGIK